MNSRNKRFSLEWLLNGIANEMLEPKKMMGEYIEEMNSPENQGLLSDISDPEEKRYMHTDMKTMKNELLEVKKLIEETIQVISEAGIE